MYAIENERTKVMYRGDGKGIKDLSCERVQRGMIRSFWKPTDDEIQILKDGGYIELLVWTEPIPPFSIAAITVADAKEPVEVQ